MIIVSYLFGRKVYEQGQREAREAQSSLLQSQTNLAGTAASQAKWDLQLSKEQWAFQKKQSAAAGEFASKFMGEWSNAMKDMKGMYGKTFDSLFGGKGGTGAIGGQVGKLNELGDLMTQEYKDYRTRWGGTEKEFMDQAMGEGRARGEALGELKEYAKTDYEGVTGRAAADVAGQSEMKRQGAAREQMGYGIDPSAGKFGALTRRSYLDEARDTAISMNVARRGEKERAAGVNLDIARTADPNVSGNLALGISRGGQDLARTAANVYGTGAQALTARTQALTNLTDSYGRNVTQPYGEMAGYFMGAGGVPGGGGSSGNSVQFGVSRGSSGGAIPEG